MGYKLFPQKSQQTIIKSMQQMIEQRSEDKITVALKAILKNAELHSEIRLEKLTPRIISLPWDLLRSELDNIFILLVHMQAGIVQQNNT
ncbi:hypothetical protein [Desulfosporosinus orientis]|uniref:hypothetical protein n=1 Tax=Desulfosporosinus orientis TaxID=1563 RepID=UPI0003060521|nr:hypothetical protein [Desulfosporosinus orientis]